jgi:hypothetical protein
MSIRLLFPAVCAAALLSSGAAQADVTLYKNNGTEINGAFKAEAGLFKTRGTNFGGAGGFDWSEGYVKPKVTASQTLSETGRKVYGGLSAVGSFTRDDGDATGFFTNGEPEEISMDLAYIGYNSGALAGKPLGINDVDFSVGRNNLFIGDGFLIGDPHFDNGDEGVFYLSPREAFKNSAILKFNGDSWRSDVFWIRGDKDQSNAQVGGVNAEYQIPDSLRLGALYLNTFDATAVSRTLNPDARNGLQTASARFQGSPNSVLLPNWLLSGEGAYQWNTESRQEVDAYAWYLEGGYTFKNVYATPTLSYRYAQFSGDETSTADKDEAFDPMFYGYGRGRGTWFIGEVIGQYLVPNSNINFHQIHAKGTFTEKLSGGMLYYWYQRNENVAGKPGGSKNFAQEIDLYADIKVTDYLSFSLVYAIALPQAAATREFTGTNGYANDPYQTAFAIATVSF